MEVLRPQTVTVSQVYDMLARACQEAGSQKAWADKHGISEQYVSNVLKRWREPGDGILRALGLERVITYRADACP